MSQMGHRETMALRVAVLVKVAKASARYVASHRGQAVRFQEVEGRNEYVAAAKALDEALAELQRTA